MQKNAQYWIDKLQLLPHPEGGYYKEVYRDQGLIKQGALAESFNGDRSYSTAIFYLLDKGNRSYFHRIKSDELWHFYAGEAINIYYLERGVLHTLKLGLNLDNGELPLHIVPKNTWFAAELKTDKSFTLVGCTVAPGFDFSDFEKASISDLKEYLESYPDIINRFIK